ncbi:hypothetical protein [Lignipirellula cremea]|uniref:SCO6045-like C-terminal domain-containing protein n=1 Tax=Lignipirellula cremea TaxID=2528010 RepID=A0A518DX84_9BACT|nr:hypothetical protein [Lignipirellula cremea]QDU96424.1 hypothetical protein Pla8534_42440 [Lignipirellula cremea]
MPHDLTTALGLLLSNRELRRRLREAPAEVACELGLSGPEEEALRQIDLDGLERQAAALLGKRWWEVGKLLPLTIAALGSEAREVFEFYATRRWPDGHRRHAVDAVEFLAFLKQNGLPAVSTAEARRVRRLSRGQGG